MEFYVLTTEEKKLLIRVCGSITNDEDNFVDIRRENIVFDLAQYDSPTLVSVWQKSMLLDLMLYSAMTTARPSLDHYILVGDVWRFEFTFDRGHHLLLTSPTRFSDQYEDLEGYVFPWPRKNSLRSHVHGFVEGRISGNRQSFRDVLPLFRLSLD